MLAQKRYDDIPTIGGKRRKSVIPVENTQPKKESKKREVYPFQPEDIQKMIEHFESNEKWIHYLLFIISCNMARRVGDNLNLQWKHFFNENGTFREDLLEIQEEKTDKLANPHINKAVKQAINKYLEKMNYNPADNNYEGYVFMQLSGTHCGKVLTKDASLKAIKNAAKVCGITYNVGNHSTRKTFGMINRMLHPNDYDAMQILQKIYNHSSESSTMHYIGLDKAKADKYYDDMGDFFNDCVFEKKNIVINNCPVLTIGTADLRDILKMAYDMGMENSKETDYNIHVETMNILMNMVDELKK